MGKLKDLSGQKFGKLIVIKIDHIHKYKSSTVIYWLCKCDCGNECVVCGHNLSIGKTKSCGCLINGIKDLTGQKFGRLTVLYRDYSDSHNSIYWHCRCDCGVESNVRANALTSGNTKSCGCIQNENRKRIKDDLTDKIFGDLKVLHRVENKNKGVVWHCICKCGRECDVRSDCLKNGNTTSCGCKFSKGEEEIMKYLDLYSIEYITQYKFNNCKNIHPLPFDFYLPKSNICIEYQGQQHYEPVDFAGKGKEWAKNQFQKLKNRDEIKRRYCMDNNIFFLEISYIDFNKIEEILKIIVFQ